MSTPLTLNNGVEIPAIGLGVFQTPPDETVAAVVSALEIGYRHIDTAAAYGNEKEVGQAICESGVPFEDIFIAHGIPHPGMVSDRRHHVLP